MLKAEVAHFSIRGIFLTLVSVLILISCGFATAWFVVVHNGKAQPIAILVLACSLALSLIVTWVTKQIVFDAGLALWVETGHLVYLNRIFFVVECSAVQGLSTSSIGLFNRPQIVLHMRDGTTKAIPAAGLAEPIDVVLSRLRAELCV